MVSKWPPGFNDVTTPFECSDCYPLWVMGMRLRDAASCRSDSMKGVQCLIL